MPPTPMLLIFFFLPEYSNILDGLVTFQLFLQTTMEGCTINSVEYLLLFINILVGRANYGTRIWLRDEKLFVNVGLNMIVQWNSAT